MILNELTGKMYYSQKIRIYEVNRHNKLDRTLIADISNSQLLSDTYKPLRAREVVGYGISSDTPAGTIDINVEEMR